MGWIGEGWEEEEKVGLDRRRLGWIGEVGLDRRKLDLIGEGWVG